MTGIQLSGGTLKERKIGVCNSFCLANNHVSHDATRTEGRSTLEDQGKPDVSLLQDLKKNPSNAPLFRLGTLAAQQRFGGGKKVST